MSVDDILSRHRPDERLGRDERSRRLAALVPSEEQHRGSDDAVILDLRDRELPPGSRRPWLPAAAAAMVVVACAGGLAAWRAGGAGHAPVAGGREFSSTCSAELPASWDAARSATPLQVDGHDAVPRASSPQGVEVLSWDATPTQVAFGLRRIDGEVTRGPAFAAGDSDGPRVYATDGRHILFGFSAGGTGGTDTTDIQLVDSTTHSSVHLLPAAPMPEGWVVQSDIAMFDGYVYWGATPGATDDSRGIVIRYSIAGGTYRVLARLDRFPTVASDIRGVAWPTGSARRHGLPAALNPILDVGGDPVDRLVTDGSTYAWQLIDGDQTLFHWVDSTGETRTYRVTVGSDHDGAGLTGVSGPFMFFHVNKDHGSEYVLDTRTGALAHSDRDEEIVSAPGKHLFAMTSGFEYHEVVASALSGFGCN